MPYIRISIAKPWKGEEENLRKVLERLNEEASAREGCLGTHLIRANDDSGDVGRIAIYRDEAAADAAASSQSIMSLRSEMHLLVQPGHTERAFFAED